MREVRQQLHDDEKLAEIGRGLVCQLKARKASRKPRGGGKSRVHWERYLPCSSVTSPPSVYGRKIFERNLVIFVHKDFSVIIGGQVICRRVPLGPCGERVLEVGQGCELHVTPVVRRSTRLDMMSVW